MLLVAMAASGLGAAVSTSGATVANGVQGTVLRGPTTPVCMVGRSCSSPVAGALVTIRRVSSAASTVAARGRTDAKGHFRFVLPPASYLVTVRASSGIEPRTGARRVQVVAGRFTSVRFVFDTGIR